MSGERRWVAVAVLVSLFLSGVAVGGVGVLLLRDGPSPDRSFRPPALPGSGAAGGPRVSPPAFVSEAVVERLAEELELSPAQRDSVEAILRRQRTVAQQELAEVYPRLRASVDSASAQIRRVLEPEQQARFDEMDIPAGDPPGPPFDSGRIRPPR